ncbi:thioesterase II family protein [Paenibacillus glufosinatiresistens]|uniref:thioesterase II family protein n=1 Tax=Paenibacillus glufosinatiresistens TaxID=3070657 RepID=UPI00286E6368|nr:alpha/beta fold hydrolase [Paenibacillus sp. YX.27]
MKLICCPYAGAHVNVFTGLHKQIRARLPDLGLLAVEYAGHGRRLSEPALESIAEQAADLLARLEPELDPDEELILLGYSMGSLIVYELAQLLKQRGFRIGKLIFMAATPPHRVRVSEEDLEEDEALLEHCRVYGLIKEHQFDSPQMRRLFLPALRSDIAAVGRYNTTNGYRCRRFPAEIEVAVFQGRSDRSVTAPEDWKDVTEGELARYDYPGGHFFLYECQEEVVSDLLLFIQGSKRPAI